jgi:hypothetical protein
MISKSCTIASTFATRRFSTTYLPTEFLRAPRAATGVRPNDCKVLHYCLHVCHQTVLDHILAHTVFERATGSNWSLFQDALLELDPDGRVSLSPVVESLSIYFSPPPPPSKT